MAVGVALLAVTCGCSSAHQYVAPSATTTPTAVVIRPTRGSTTSSSSPTTSSPAGTVASTTTAPPTTTTTAAPVTQPTAPATGLAALILNAAPSGYPRQPDDVGQTGPTDITKAALDDVSTNARRALLVTGFVGGYQRQWTSGDGFTIDQIFLYEFETAKGAQGYAQHWHDTLLSSNQGAALTSFTPAFIPGATGLQAQQSNVGSTGVVMFAKGTYAVEATVNSGALNGGQPLDMTGPATGLAVAQYQLLP